ncbi:MAG: hypothetical protein HZA54_19465 [Planctomycetes bacterium]|nr:hypothetical protein [Planctomycetota bacterium]
MRGHRVKILGSAALAAALTAGGVPAMAQDQPAMPAPVLEGDAGTPELAAKKKEITNKLVGFKLSFDFTDAQLDDIISFCREVSGINFVIDRRVWDKYRPEELRVTIKLADVSLRTALRFVLEPRGLTMIFRDGVILVVPKETLDEELVLEIYDVKDLMTKIPDFPGPEVALTAGSEAATGVDFNAPTESTVLTDPDRLSDLIRKNVGGDSWDRVGGTSISIANGILFVVQSRRVQREVAHLVVMLRQFK